MASEVYFMNTRATFAQSSFTKLNRLFEQLKLKLSKGDLVAIKLHFGELGNISFIRPVWVREVVKWIRKLGGQPFLTDTSTLYAGSRSQAVSHLQTAVANGFDYACVEAPLIMADGLRGESEVKIEVNHKHFRQVEIAQLAAEADFIVTLSHFKGHQMAGFGGALKNIGMGLASRAGKYKMHLNAVPKIGKKGCKKCQLCLNRCPGKAITLKEAHPELDPDKCLGCGQCLIVCPQKMFNVDWQAVSQEVFQERLVEFASGVLLNQRACYLNFILDVTPDCDCCSHSDAAIVPDVGITASWDPVAIDQASVDLVNQQIGLGEKKGLKAGQDKFAQVNWKTQLEYAQELGLGSRDYRLIEV